MQEMKFCPDCGEKVKKHERRGVIFFGCRQCDSAWQTVQSHPLQIEKTSFSLTGWLAGKEGLIRIELEPIDPKALSGGLITRTSKCCGASITISGGGVKRYVCSKCGQTVQRWGDRLATTIT